MNIDGFQITLTPTANDPAAWTITIYRWGMNLIVQFATLELLLLWVYNVGCAKVHYPDGLLLGVLRELARDCHAQILYNEFP